MEVNNMTKKTEIKEKLKKIMDCYAKRMTQKEIAEQFSMQTEEVQKVAQAYGMYHTKQLTSANVKPGQLINGIICFEDFKFLLNYNF